MFDVEVGFGDDWSCRTLKNNSLKTCLEPSPNKLKPQVGGKGRMTNSQLQCAVVVVGGDP